MLEDLVMDGIFGFAWDFASVSVTTLKRLTFYWGVRNENLKSVSFDTPNLVYLDYTDTVADKYPKVNFGLLVEAKINLRKTDGNATNFIVGLCNVKILNLSSDTLEVLTYCCKAIPLFNNLTHLTIDGNGRIGWKSLPAGLLKNSPNLETLVLLGLLYKSRYGELRWCNPDEKEEEEIPTCLSSSPVKVLKIMEFGSVGPDEIEEQLLEQINYFLEKMPNLEQLIFYIDLQFEEADLIAVFNLLHRLLNGIASSKCHIKIITEELCVSSTVP
ncbi:hypothetical protein AALP_AA5G240200 [Arabis alpina]|uniref:FBD domain-containing protein n=1 Tax=Arabis alpina TaxID=50452 RepID=A0A087GZ24_ARAAL|nr:hypothetical protein AALP_AA5G240200 [Arabis alpina]